MFVNKKTNLDFISDNLRDYAKAMTKNAQFSAFIEFKTNFLAGNWDGKYGLVRFTDHRIETSRQDPLKHFLEIVVETQNKSMTEIYHFPHPFCEKVKEIVQKKRYFSNSDYMTQFPVGSKKRNFAYLSLTDDNVIHESIDMSQWKELKVGFTELTPTEYAEVMLLIHSLPEDEKNYILDYHKKKAQKSAERDIEYYFKTQSCYERPFSIDLFGNDDCAYTRLFETKEQAWECYKDLAANAMKEDGYDLVDRLGFDFSG